MSALCHAPRAGVAPVCSEEIRLLAPPEEADLLAGAIDPLLVPDLPVALWAAGDPCHPLLPSLSEHAETFIADSRGARSMLDAWHFLARKLAADEALCTVDLAWRSIAVWRHAVAEVFDEPAVRALLPHLSRLEIDFAPRDDTSPPAEATLLAGWVLSRLRWGIERVEPVTEGWTASGRKISGKRTSLRLRVSETRGDVEPGAPVALRFLAGASLSEPHAAIALERGALRAARITWMTPSTCRLPKARAFPRPSLPATPRLSSRERATRRHRNGRS